MPVSLPDTYYRDSKMIIRFARSQTLKRNL
jgi:hypothetical protein